MKKTNLKKPVLMLAGTAAIGLIGMSQSANACADGCYNTWSLVQDFYQNCADFVGISPSNDTRANIMLLMMDRDGGKSIPAPAKTDKDYQYRQSELPFIT